MTGQRSPPLVQRVGKWRQQVGIKSGWSWVVYRLRCMNYYEPVMLLPYVSRIPLVVNTAPTSFNSISEEEEDKIWHYSATVSNNDWVQN
jgi:hypothetical protein